MTIKVPGHESEGILKGPEIDIKTSSTALELASITRAAFSDIGLFDYLIINRQPSFVVLLTKVELRTTLRIVYCNPALLEQAHLYEDLQELLEHDDQISPRRQSELAAWIVAERTDVVGSTYIGRRYIWTDCCTIQKRYIVISGIPFPPRERGSTAIRNASPSQPSSVSAPSQDTNHAAKLAVQENTPEQQHEGVDSIRATFDLTQNQYDINSLTPHQSYVVNINWSTTHLGDMSTWSDGLRAAFNTCLTDSNAACIFWGEQNVFVYNHFSIPLIAGHHPCAGQPVLEALPRYTEVTGGIINQIRATGQTVSYEDLPLFYSRDGNDDVEGYFTLRTSPILSPDGSIAGMYQSITESTSRLLLQRRVDTFIDIGAQMMEARTLREVWQLIITSMTTNPKDIPFAVLYSLADDVVHLEGSVNVPDGHPAVVASFKIESDNHVGFAPLFRECMKWRKLLVVHVADGSLPSTLVNGIASEAFGDAIRSIAISPILNGDTILGILVIGCNPRRPYDEPYASFITQLSRLIATGVASTMLIDEANNVQANLNKQLGDHQQRLQRQGTQFRALAERVGVAIFVTDLDGRYTFRNDIWFELFPSAASATKFQSTWEQLLDNDSIEAASTMWQNLLAGKEQLRIELKLKRKWNEKGDLAIEGGNSIEHSIWILASAFSATRADGSVEEITCAFTDISHQKWSEKIQQLRSDTALEARRQLEQFIDNTSHEMRNPLGAITHCADELLSIATTALAETATSEGEVSVTQAVLREVLESAETIVSCSSHMKRIVDDVLTMSKLDGNLMVVTPTEVEPMTEIRNILKLFRAEAEGVNVSLSDLAIGQGLTDLVINTVEMDSVRVSQILVNLISNAIKFTQFSATRRVEVTLDATRDEPTNELGVQRVLQPDIARQDVPMNLKWTADESLYIILRVKDTGKGLTKEESDTLFRRFSQGSPRTYVKYGGNGLGLYISRKIAELHGGAIGFCSKPGVGSTFAFYIKVRRISQAPTSTIETSTRTLPSRPRTDPEVSAGSALLQNDEVLNWRDVFILVVEDNLVNQKILVKQLRKLGCKVSAVNDGLECLEYVETTKYWSTTAPRGANLTIILLDWEMPNCNGLECASRLRALQRNGRIMGHIPIMGMTANARAQQIEQAIAAGMDDVVSKPFRIVELSHRIEKLLAKCSPKRQKETTSNDAS